MALKDSLKKRRIKHPGFDKADHAVVVFGPADLKADGRQMLCGEDTSAHAIHVPLDRLRQGFLNQRRARWHKLHCPALNDDELAIGRKPVRLQILIDGPKRQKARFPVRWAVALKHPHPSS